jgi:hypothetical protein
LFSQLFCSTCLFSLFVVSPFTLISSTLFHWFRYTDPREEARLKEEAEKAKGDNMENWTQEQLEAAVAAKDKGNATEIICKYFIEAVETRKYVYPTLGFVAVLYPCSI